MTNLSITSWLIVDPRSFWKKGAKTIKELFKNKKKPIGHKPSGRECIDRQKGPSCVFFIRFIHGALANPYLLPKIFCSFLPLYFNAFKMIKPGGTRFTEVGSSVNSPKGMILLGTIPHTPRLFIMLCVFYQIFNRNVIFVRQVYSSYPNLYKGKRFYAIFVKNEYFNYIQTMYYNIKRRNFSDIPTISQINKLLNYCIEIGFIKNQYKGEILELIESCIKTNKSQIYEYDTVNSTLFKLCSTSYFIVALYMLDSIVLNKGYTEETTTKINDSFRTSTVKRNIIFTVIPNDRIILNMFEMFAKNISVVTNNNATILVDSSSSSKFITITLERRKDVKELYRIFEEDLVMQTLFGDEIESYIGEFSFFYDLPIRHGSHFEYFSSKIEGID